MEPSTISSKFTTDFNVLEMPYKTVNNQDINAFIAIPKNAKPGKHPIIVRFHGGWFITGSALYPDWFPIWQINYLLNHDAILISPNYRLIPESRGPDIYSDLTSFWNWLHITLPTLLSKPEKTTNLFGPGITADLDHIMVSGESAGGTLALLSALSFSNLGNSKGKITACVSSYPVMMDFKSEKYVQKIAKGSYRPFGAPEVPTVVWEQHVASMIPGQVVSSCVPPGRLPLIMSSTQHGLLGPYFDDDERMFPLKVLEKVGGGDVVLPYILILHGKQDSVVELEGSEEFLEKAEKILGRGKVELVVRDGEHGFDSEIPVEPEWLTDALKKSTELWLGKGE